MRFIRITRDVWVNLELAESVIQNSDGTATIQTRSNVWQTEIPFEAVIMRTAEETHEPPPPPPAVVNSPLIAETRPAW